MLDESGLIFYVLANNYRGLLFHWSGVFKFYFAWFLLFFSGFLPLSLSPSSSFFGLGDWSVGGKYVSVARKNILSILSSKFKERLSISLSFDSWIGDSDVNCSVKGNVVVWYYTFSGAHSHENLHFAPVLSFVFL